MLILLVSCKQEKQQYKTSEIKKNGNELLENEYLIKGQTFNPDFKTVYLYDFSQDELTLLDSISVTDNSFSIKGSINNPTYFMLKTNVSDEGFRFLADASNISLFLSDDVISSSTFSNTALQEQYRVYKTALMDFEKKGIGLYYGLKGDFSKSKINNLKNERAKLFKEQSEFLTDFIEDNPDSYFTAMLIEKHFNEFETSKLRSLYDGLSLSIKETEIAGLLNQSITDLEVEEAAKSKEISKPKTEYREQAYAFSGLNPQGQTMSLASIPTGKVVLLDFWASWCGPCRATNPNLVNLYNKYKDQGFTIMSISEDKGQAEWINAIYADNLTWPYHVLDNNKSIAFRYGVEAIPFKILIDKQGRIASGKISGNALESRIQQLLAE